MIKLNNEIYYRTTTKFIKLKKIANLDEEFNWLKLSLVWPYLYPIIMKVLGDNFISKL